jgi:hypothetical protein
MPLRHRVRSLIAARRLPRRSLQRPPIESKGVAIVVLSWNGRECTLRCLDSLQRARLDGASILVVDNGSSDGSTDAIRTAFPAIPLLPLPENVGYAAGNNVGIRAALEQGCDAVLLLNNDTEVAPDFLEPLVEVLNIHGDAAAVSSAIMRIDVPEVLQEAYFDLYFGFGIIRRRGVNALPGEGYDAVRQVDAAIGCSLLMRSEALRHVGLLDESYFAYHEEVDWCWRARKAGWLIYYQPYSRVWHHYSKSTAATRPQAARRWSRTRRADLPNPLAVGWNPVRTYLGARNSVRFIRRHASWPRKLYFLLSTAYAIPLELLAAVLEREEELKLGLLTYRRALAWYCLEETGARGGVEGGRWRTPLRDRLRALVHAPRLLLRSLPREIARARRTGVTAQVEACVRGHWDGLLDRPLPLRELGLQSSAPAPAPVSRKADAAP